MTREEKAQFCIDNLSEYPAFQFYPDNWFGSRHVSAMTIEQRGIHACLIFSAWLEKNCGIPENEICLSARIPDKMDCAFVLASCWFLYKGFWFCERLLKERIKLIELSNTRKRVGNLGGRPIESKIKKIKPIGNQLDSKRKPNDNQTDNDNDNDNEDINSSKKEGNGGKEKTWRNDFETYKAECDTAFEKYANDWEWIEEKKRFHPYTNIRRSLEKMFNEYWGMESGWKNKKSCRKTITIDWLQTINNGLSMDLNRVRIPKGQPDIEQEEIEKRKHATV